MAALDPKSKAEAKADTEGKNKKELKNDTNFDDWYDSLEDELFEASHDEYKYGPHMGIAEQMLTGA